jgi:murein L,D-transpeptidase YafK
VTFRQQQRKTGTISLPRAALLFASFSIGCASSVVSQDERADQIVVIKSQHTMTLLSHGHTIKVYRVALGKGGGGPKRQLGDHETPEGACIIDSKNTKSRFHLALHVSYPNAADRITAQAEGVPTGGDIMIHGVERQFAWMGSLQHEVDWTDGCIAVTNPEIEEISRLVPIGTPIEIKP